MTGIDTYFKRRVHHFEVNGEVRHVVPLSGFYAEELLNAVADGKSTTDMNTVTRVFCQGVCDEEGNAFFPDSPTDADIQKMKQRVDYDVIKRVAEEILEVSGMYGDGEEDDAAPADGEPADESVNSGND